MGTWASVDPELLELSDDGRTVTRLAPRNLHEHACALGGTVLREGCHRWDVELDHVWEDQGGINLCVGVAARADNQAKQLAEDLGRGQKAA